MANNTGEVTGLINSLMTIRGDVQSPTSKSPF